MDSKQNILFCNVRIIGCEPFIPLGWLLTKDNQIHSFGVGQPPDELSTSAISRIDGQGSTLLPGFIDLHTHGALGADFVFGTRDDIFRISSFYAEHGVTSFLATTYAATSQEINTALQNILSAMGHEPGARILGIHLEGPWLNPSKAGAQNRTVIRAADQAEVIPYLESGLVRQVSLAPEIKENRWLISACHERGIIASAGHTEASYQQMTAAVKKGMTQVTHCFNAMNPLHHREPGVIGAALTLPQLQCELIADNFHVHPVVMNLLYNAKKADGVILITDSIAAAGMPEGVYTLEGQPVFCKDNTVRLADGTLAGSVLTMDRALNNFIEAVNQPLEIVWPSSSLNAAKALKIHNHTGKISSGYDADLVLLDSNLHVELTMIQGKISGKNR